MIGSFETRVLSSVLVGGMAGKDGRDIKDDGCFFVCERILGDGFMRKSVVPMRRCSQYVIFHDKLLQAAVLPCERDLDMVLINGKPEIQQFQLAIISIQQVASSSAILACASHILAQPVEGCALFAISLGIITVDRPDVVLERANPIDLVRLLQRT